MLLPQQTLQLIIPLCIIRAEREKQEKEKAEKKRLEEEKEKRQQAAKKERARILQESAQQAQDAVNEHFSESLKRAVNIIWNINIINYL